MILLHAVLAIVAGMLCQFDLIAIGHFCHFVTGHGREIGTLTCHLYKLAGHVYPGRA